MDKRVSFELTGLGLGGNLKDAYKYFSQMQSDINTGIYNSKNWENNIEYIQFLNTLSGFIKSEGY